MIINRILLTLLFALLAGCMRGDKTTDNLQPGDQYEVIRPIYLQAVYRDLNERQVSRDTASAFLTAHKYYKTSWVAFESTVQSGSVMTITAKGPRVWHLPCRVQRYYVSLDPDLSSGLEVVLDLDRGIEGDLDGLNESLFRRRENIAQQGGPGYRRQSAPQPDP